MAKWKIIGFDISKASIQLAAKSDDTHSIKWFIGNSAALSLQNQSINCIVNSFSPANYAEFQRVLTPNGYLIKIIPGNSHLQEFRHKLSRHLSSPKYTNQPTIMHMMRYFPIVYRQTTTACLQISSLERKVFADMTPLLFHIDKEKVDLTDVDFLTIEAEIVVGQKPAPNNR